MKRPRKKYDRTFKKKAVELSNTRGNLKETAIIYIMKLRFFVYITFISLMLPSCYTMKPYYTKSAFDNKMNKMWKDKSIDKVMMASGSPDNTVITPNDSLKIYSWRYEGAKRLQGDMLQNREVIAGREVQTGTVNVRKTQSYCTTRFSTKDNIIRYVTSEGDLCRAKAGVKKVKDKGKTGWLAGSLTFIGTLVLLFSLDPYD